jgi:hypothetical protein
MLSMIHLPWDQIISKKMKEWRTRVYLNRKIVTRVQETRTASIELEKV